MFFPRGGSAQVARYLSRELAAVGGRFPHGWWPPWADRGPGGRASFFAGIDLVPVDYTAALRAPDPLAASPPLHPSYEDRPGRPIASWPRSATGRSSISWTSGERILDAPASWTTSRSRTCTTSRRSTRPSRA